MLTSMNIAYQAGQALSGFDVTAGEWMTTGVAAIAAVAVIYQSVHTRRSADASKDAANAAVKGLEIANSALQVARDEERHSRTLVTETVRTHMDATLPEVSVAFASDPIWPYIGGGQQWDLLTPDRRLRSPGEHDLRVALLSSVSLSNGSNRLVEFKVEYTPGRTGMMDNAIAVMERSRVERVLVEPGAVRSINFAVVAMLYEWIEAGAPTSNNGQDRCALPMVSYQGSTDWGASVTWSTGIESPFVAEPMREVTGETTVTTYRLALELPAFEPSMEVREYWLSKSSGIPLEPPISAAGTD
ncbi:hypothetical protein ACQEVI_02120 [Promicromonospora sp. CA-289599]|uniref:hypothetical protein n=1 Tax=Promicromonospora sp. CA-289599 TaxID=3240014 RepID=UPI003D8C5B3F